MAQQCKAPREKQEEKPRVGMELPKEIKSKVTHN